jgi:thiol-disulfide isomerase/thioredoxin
MDEETTDITPNDDGEQEPTNEPRVITLGWPVLALPLLAVVILVGGYLLGQRRAPDVVIMPNEEPPPVVQDITGTQLGGGGVQDMPPTYHPLQDTKAPEFQMTKLGSTEKVKLSDFSGKPVLVNFWATWCPPCRYEMPWLLNVYNKYKDQGFVVLGVDAGEKVPADMVEATVRQYVESQGLEFPILMDQGTYQLQQSWGVGGLPASFIINPKGTISYVHTGMFPNEATLENLVQKILPGGEWADTEPAGAQQGAAPNGQVASQP